MTPDVAMELPLESVACPLCGNTEATPFASGVDYEYGTTGQTFWFVQCAKCALVYLSPRPAPDAVSLIYPPHYYSFTGEEEGRGIVRKLRALWEERKAQDYGRLLGPGPRKILDVGCGRGRFLTLMQRVGPPEWALYGIDLDAGAVAGARERGFHATQATIMDYEPEDRFDLIMLQQVIEHVADPRAVLQRLRDLLAPGGVVVLETPNLAGWDYRLFQKGLWGGYHFPRHWTLFTATTFRRFIEDVGLQVIEQRSLMSLSFWTWSVHHVCLTRGGSERLVRWLRPPNAVLLAFSVMLEGLQLLLGRETSNQRLVARRPA